jgi:lipoprotein-releasing system ATP-binding protein
MSEKLKKVISHQGSSMSGTGGPHIELPSHLAASLTTRVATTVNMASGSVTHLAAVGIKKNYRKASIDIPVLCGVDLEVHHGEFLAIVGQSGSGKSTLLHLLGTLDGPTAGEVHFLDKRIDNLPSNLRERLRNEQFGMIFQFYHLLPELTTLENVLAPLMIGRSTWTYWRKRSEFTKRAKELLDTVGLSHRLKHRPRELSGGEMQRVAIARALIAEPQVLLADEPTGNLDEETGRDILRILRTLNREHSLSIVMVTHDMAIADTADRTVKLVSGKVVPN